jgi:hypothetical protein
VSAHELLEPASALIEQPVSSEDVADEACGYWPISRPLPLLLTDGQLMTVLGIKSSRFYALKKLGRFRPLETQLRTVDGTRYCGALVGRFVRGEWTNARSFGAKRSRV